MAHDQKSWEEFNKIDEQNIALTSLLYTSTMDTVYGKKRGSNYTPPKKKRKKK